MFHPHAELRLVSAAIGYGVFAAEPIPAGTIVYVQDAMELTYPLDDPMLEHPVYGPIIDKYSFIDAEGARVISWDIAKYVNHRCGPNTMSTGYGFEIAVGDIAAGEEMTDEYGMFNLPRPMPCLCGAPQCRGRVHGDDPLTLAPQWDATVKAALKRLNRVAQPLISFLDEQTRSALINYLTTHRGYRSVRALHHAAPQPAAATRATSRNGQRKTAAARL